MYIYSIIVIESLYAQKALNSIFVCCQLLIKYVYTGATGSSGVSGRTGFTGATGPIGLAGLQGLFFIYT